jgi:hypothetical protein
LFKLCNRSNNDAYFSRGADWQGDRRFFKISSGSEGDIAEAFNTNRYGLVDLSRMVWNRKYQIGK